MGVLLGLVVVLNTVLVAACLAVFGCWHHCDRHTVGARMSLCVCVCVFVCVCWHDCDDGHAVGAPKASCTSSSMPRRRLGLACHHCHRKTPSAHVCGRVRVYAGLCGPMRAYAALRYLSVRP